MKSWRLPAAALFCAAAALVAALWFSIPAGPLLANVPFGGMALDSRGGIMRIALADDEKYRIRIPLEQVAPGLIAAVLEYEDRHFYAHPGINPVALARGFFSLLGGRRMGGSTITMQTARLLFKLDTASISGKLKQIWLALALELGHGKAEILEAYFNLAPYGGNVEGVEAASRIYFHKPAALLTPLECQALALAPQNPAARRPGGRDFDSARRRAYGQAPALAHSTPAHLPFRAQHLGMELLGRQRDKIWQTGIEPDLQAILDRCIANFAQRGARSGLNNAAAILVRISDMMVVASTGSAAWGDAAISGALDGTRARRSPGSTLKPFIYALALDQGLIHPQTILEDSPKSFGGYDPENFDLSFRGPVPAHEALKASRNLPAIALAEQLREPGLYGFLRAAGVGFTHGPEHYGLALALGGAEVTMRELAALYAMLANHGLWRPPVFTKDQGCQASLRLLSPEAAWLALNMLRREDAMAGDAPVFYKTGTSNGLRDAWTAGIAGGYALVVWAGNFDNRPNPRLVGAETALPLFEDIALALASARKLGDAAAAPPPGLAKAAICPETGDFYRGQCASPVENWIWPGVSPVRDSGVSRRILIDRKTGLRACAPEGADEVWWEFWPSDMKNIFAQAGIFKPDAPDWLPQCRGAQKSAVSGRAPRILLPKKHVVYRRRQTDQMFRLPLQAAAEAGAGNVHWYSGTKYLGSSKPGEIIFWDAPYGASEIMAVNDAGASVKQECAVLLAP